MRVRHVEQAHAHSQTLGCASSAQHVDTPRPPHLYSQIKKITFFKGCPAGLLRKSRAALGSERVRAALGSDGVRARAAGVTAGEDPTSFLGLRQLVGLYHDHYLGPQPKLGPVP